MGDGSGDLQKTWHEFAGSLFSNKTILDVGAGVGRSKERLSVNGNEVTTQDINRAMMTKVDFISYPEDINYNSYDIVTAFDVVEHTVSPAEFINTIWNISREGIFVTTPNVEYSPGPWHYDELGFIKLVEFNIRFSGCSGFSGMSGYSGIPDPPLELEIFYRYKFSDGKDIITKEKLDERVKIPMAFGILVKK
jgi:hypothetical protein